MSSLNRYLKIFIISLIWLFVSIFVVNWEDFPYTLSTDSNASLSDQIKTWSLWEIVIPDDTNSTLDQLSQSFLWTDFRDEDNPAIYYISKFINYFLSILAFIAFIILVYWFSMVFTGKTDEWIKKWGKFIKMAIIAIITIWVSWLIAMWVISIYAQHVVSS